MCQVLINYARQHRAKKRGGNKERVPLDDLLVSFEDRAVGLVALQEGLEELAKLDEQKSRIVELRLLGGLNIFEVAKVLSISHATVERQWRFARAWLHQRITEGDGEA